MRCLIMLLFVTFLLTTGSARGESIERHQQFIVVGKTSQQEIRNILGNPQETITESGVDVWVYNEQLEVPMAVSLIPVVGDIADILGAVSNIQKNQELIIQFDPNGIVRKHKLRKLN